jgi:hypothetical protein
MKTKVITTIMKIGSILLNLTFIFIAFNFSGCKEEKQEKIWVMKVIVNEKQYLVNKPIPSTDHSGVKIGCYNNENISEAITNYAGYAELKCLNFGAYDIMLELEGTKKLYCSETFSKNMDTLEMDIFKLQKDTLIDFKYDTLNDNINYTYVLRNSDNPDWFDQTAKFLYFFYDNSRNVSHMLYKIRKIHSAYYDYFGPVSVAGGNLLKSLRERGFPSGDSVFFKVYTGNPNISVCQRDTSEVTYYFGFSDSTEVFGFVMP